MMSAPDSTSTRPYLIRALYEWCTDSGFTPYVAVLVDDTVRVPREYVKNGEIVLNISFDATSSLKLGNEFIEFKARFAGTPREILIPVTHVIAIYARENGQGMAFPMSVPSGGDLNSTNAQVPAEPVELGETNVVQLVHPEAEGADTHDGPESPKPPSGPRPALKRVK